MSRTVYRYSVDFVDVVTLPKLPVDAKILHVDYDKGSNPFNLSVWVLLNKDDLTHDEKSLIARRIRIVGTGGNIDKPLREGDDIRFINTFFVDKFAPLVFHAFEVLE